MALKWYGDEIKRKFQRAAETGINKTMADAVTHFKGNHPGWQNRTTTAEGSVRIQQSAKSEGNRIVGRWGSIGVDYMIWLELKHGSALRSAGDATYPKLIDRIRRGLS